LYPVSSKIGAAEIMGGARQRVEETIYPSPLPKSVCYSRVEEERMGGMEARQQMEIQNICGINSVGNRGWGDLHNHLDRVERGLHTTTQCQGKEFIL